MSDWPIWNYPMQAAQIAVRYGFSAQASYEVLASLGVTVTRGEYDRLYGQAEMAARMVGPTGALPLDQLPDQDLIQTHSTVTSSGYQYQLQIETQDVDTGEMVPVPYSIVTDELIEPGEAIQSAIVATNLRTPEYRLKALGARLTGVYRLVPQGT